MEKNNKYGVWTKYFSEGYTRDWYEMLRATADHHAKNFMRGVNEGTIQIEDDFAPASLNPGLDKWVEDNQSLLLALVNDIQNHIDAVSEFSLPAHDIRQILVKDASEGLRFAEMEKPQGYKATFVIPTFSHDIGRLLEGRFYDEKNPHDKWIPHAQLSFLLFKEILDKPVYQSMPRELKNHFLYAVLAHSGDNGKSYMSRAVQACDRMQLIGAEGFFRAVSYGICLMDADIKYPDDDRYETNLPDMYEHRSVLSMLEYFSRNMRENIGDQHQEWRNNVFAENYALLLKASEGDDILRKRIFAPELSPCNYFGSRKQPIDKEIMERAKVIVDRAHGYSGASVSPHSVFAQLSSLLQSPIGAAGLTRGMQQSLNRAVNDMPSHQLCALSDTVALASNLRDEQDRVDSLVVLRAAKSPYAYYRQIAQKASEFCPLPEQKIDQPRDLSSKLTSASPSLKLAF